MNERVFFSHSGTLFYKFVKYTFVSRGESVAFFDTRFQRFSILVRILGFALQCLYSFQFQISFFYFIFCCIFSVIVWFWSCGQIPIVFHVSFYEKPFCMKLRATDDRGREKLGKSNIRSTKID